MGVMKELGDVSEMILLSNGGEERWRVSDGVMADVWMDYVIV
jgi:hypothetical protein